MKPRSVEIECTKYDPGEISGFPEGAHSCDALAVFPDGKLVTQSTGPYASERVAHSAAEKLQKRLMSMNWEQLANG